MCGPCAVIVKYIQSKAVKRVMGLVGMDLKMVHGGCGYYLFGIGMTLIVYLYKLGISLLQLDSCFYVWKGKSCYYAYVEFSSAAVLGYSVFHFALLVERINATFFNSNQKHGSVCGWLLSVLMIVGPNAYIFSTNGAYVFTDRTYCHSLIAVSASFNVRALYSTFGMVAADCVITCCDFILLAYNRWQIARFYRKITDYNLDRSYTLRQMNISMRLIFPVSLAHAVGYSFQLMTVALYFLFSQQLSEEMDVFMKEIVNFIRTFSIFALFISVDFYSVRREKQTAEWIRKESATDRYFAEFNRLIS
ncbi:hypothetical protein M3Y99_01809600 [Aphelenchoides fujianensis]|nr:hypothetical protein M3Y99_01809600 [Aphelenchoides fujianensis]